MRARKRHGPPRYNNVGVVCQIIVVSTAKGRCFERTTAEASGAHVHAFIRGRLESTFGAATAARVVVQYGGSVKADNARQLLASPDIDGALVGGASLKAADILGIIAAAREVAAAGKP